MYVYLGYTFCDVWSEWSGCDRGCGSVEARERLCYAEDFNKITIHTPWVDNITVYENRHCECDSGKIKYVNISIYCTYAKAYISQFKWKNNALWNFYLTLDWI